MTFSLLLFLTGAMMSMSSSSFAQAASLCNSAKTWNGKIYSCRTEKLILSPGKELTIDAGVNGSVEVTADDEPSIRVTAVATAWLDKADEAEAAFRNIRIVARSEELSSYNPDSSLNHIWSVSFNVSIPKSLPVIIKAKNGGVSATGVQAGLLVTTENGAVSVDQFTGNVSLTSKNGSIELRPPQDVQGDLHVTARTRNGSISIGLPEPFRLGLKAESETGHVLVDPSLGAITTGTQTSIQGEQQEAAIALSTIVGNIKISNRGASR